MLFKKLTRHDGDEIFVNVAAALTMRRDGNETTIVFPGVDVVRVKETPRDIMAAPAA